MYEQYWSLNEPPFSITPDPRFLFHTRNHRDALAYLHYGIEQRKGFLVLTGEVGVGKTLIIRTLLGQLASDVDTAIVMNARLSFRQLLYMALIDFDLQPAGRSRVDLLMTLQEFLIRLKHKGRNAVLIIDEAQNLSERSLEEFRLLSNMDTASEKLLPLHTALRVLAASGSRRRALVGWKLPSGGLRMVRTSRTTLPKA